MKYQILLVSEDMEWQTTTRRGLEKDGYSVTSARGAGDALREVSIRLPNLVVHEPGRDEKEQQLPRQVRALPGGSRLPFVAVATAEDRDWLPAEVGYTTILPKAATGAVLLRTLDALLARQDRDPVGAGRFIVLVDDNTLQRKLLRLTLAHWGFRVEEAVSAQQGLEAARRTPPAAIVSDFLMPGADGFQLCSLVKRDRALARVPVIVVSSILLPDRQFEAARELGADAFVTAGAQHRALARALVELLGAA